MRKSIVLFLFITFTISLNCSKGNQANISIKKESSPTSDLTKNTQINDTLNQKPFETICHSEKCSTFAFLKTGKKIFVTEFNKEPTCKLITGNLLKISMSCGNPCNYSIFVDLLTGATSSPLFNVLAIDTLQNLTAYCDTNAIKVSSLFDSTKKTISITRPFSPSASLITVIDSTQFKSNSLFYFHYYTGNEFTGVWDSVAISESNHRLNN